MSQAAPLPAVTAPPLALPADVLAQIEVFAQGLGLRAADVVVLGLHLLDEQLEQDPELVRSLIRELQAHQHGTGGLHLAAGPRGGPRTERAPGLVRVVPAGSLAAKGRSGCRRTRQLRIRTGDNFESGTSPVPPAPGAAPWLPERAASLDTAPRAS